jgi:hypothetical protein
MATPPFSDDRLARVRGFATHPWLPLTVAWLLLMALLTRVDALGGLLVLLGFGGGFLSGLLGVGGAVVMIPVLLYVPPLLGFARLDVHVVTGVTIVQVAAAAVAGGLGHLGAGKVDRGLLVDIGVSLTVASLAGALLSGSVDARALEAVFASLALVAAAMMLLLRSRTAPETGAPSGHRRPLAVLLGVGVGVPAGMVGAGGAFILIPLMLFVLRVPLRVAVGSSLWIVLLGAIAGVFGKAATGQIDWALALGLVAGALPGGRLGSAVSGRVPRERLAVALGLIIAVVALRMWLDVLAPA